MQFGARADLYAKGPRSWLVGRLAAEGNVYLDALVYFNPFSFDAKLGGSLSLLVDGDVVPAWASTSVCADRTPTRSTARCGSRCSESTSISTSTTMGREQSLPPATIDAEAVLREAIERSAALSPSSRWPRERRRSGLGRGGCGAIDPGGGARFMQRAVPLGVALAKIGEAQVPAHRLSTSRSSRASTALSLAPAKEEFVRGHFFELSEAERLRSPEFERFKAGFELLPTPSSSTLPRRSWRATAMR